MSKPARSGLGSVQRDWSNNAPKSSQPIEWDPTPPKPKPPVSDRMAAIQRALDSLSQNSNTPPPGAPQQKQPGKRLSSEGVADENATSTNKRARVLPWKTDSLAGSSSTNSSGFGNDSINTSAKSGSKPSMSKLLPGSSKKVAPVFLSQEQTHVLQLVQDGHNVFYTGSAGTGKSVLLREIVKTLRKKYAKYPDSVAVTASTGMAACNIGGVTIHSFAGLGIRDDQTPEEAVKTARKNKKVMSRWLRTKVLIIDEVSMLDGRFFDKLAKCAKLIRRSEQVFGGIQLVITGDFFQLPPVTKSGRTHFAFQAEHWNESIKYMFNLTQVFRQRDQRFIDMLNELRFGKLTQATIQEFRRLSRPLSIPDSGTDAIEATELYPTRAQVDDSNNARLGRLNTETQRYTCVDGGSMAPEYRKKTLDQFMVMEVLTLRVHSQVMLIKNCDETLVNGSVGIVEAFWDPAEYAKMEGDGPGAAVGGGSGSLAGAAKKGSSVSSGLTRKYPLVSFRLPNGARRRVLVLPEVFKIEQPNGEVTASRTQLPLILSWAMSIHKSQGQTLEYVKVDLGRIFEKGQAYVALSRATSLEGLQVLNFAPDKVQAHPEVLKWSKTLSVVDVDKDK